MVLEKCNKLKLLHSFFNSICDRHISIKIFREAKNFQINPSKNNPFKSTINKRKSTITFVKKKKKNLNFEQ